MADYAEEEWLSVLVVEDEEEARLIQGYLDSEGVPCQVESKYSHEFPTHMGALGEIEVRVPASRSEEAKRLLAAREAAFEAGEGSGGRGEGAAS
jgi:hypothetical protein